MMSIKSVVLHAAGREVSASDSATQELVACLTASKTREMAYLMSVEAMEESQRGQFVRRLLINYIPSFPPSRSMLRSIQARCAQSAGKSNASASVNKELGALAKALMTGAFENLLSEKPTRTKVQQRAQYRNHKYVATFSLQPPIGGPEPALFRIAPPRVMAQQDSNSKGEGGAAATAGASPEPAAVCNEYIDQRPLVCSDQVIAHQLGVLTHFWERYHANTAVVNATLFLIKQMCDGYVSKLPLGPPYYFFRSVTICYLPTLLEWMESDYMSVKAHVYDLLLSLSTQVQVVDSQGLYPGCTEALQQEVIWLALHVFERQALLQYDEMALTAGAKCALAVVPPGWRWLIDPRTLLQFMQLPGLAELHPAAFTAFAEAFECCLLHSESLEAAGGRPGTEETLSFNKGELRKLGPNAIAEVLALYRRSSTVGARLAFFKVLFVWAVANMVAKGDGVTEVNILRCYDALVSLELFWYLHPLLFYEPSSVHNDMPKQLLSDFSIADSSDIGNLATRVVQAILQIIDEDAELPREVKELFVSAKTAGAAVAAGGADMASARGARAVTLQEAICDAVTAVPLILKESDNRRAYNVGWRLAFYCIRCSKQQVEEAYGNEIISLLVGEIIACAGTNNYRSRPLIQDLCPDLLTSLAFLARTQAQQAVDGFNELAELVIFAPTANLSAARAMALCHRLLECVAVSDSPLQAHSADEDVVQLLSRGAMKVSRSAARSLGTRIMWALYRALVHEQTLADCRARFVLVSICAEIMPTSAAMSGPVACAWNSVALDPCRWIADYGRSKALAVAGT